MSLSLLEHLADELATIGNEAAILADLLECKATGLPEASQTEALRFVASQLRQHRARLGTIEGAFNEHWAVGRGCTMGKEGWAS